MPSPRLTENASGVYVIATTPFAANGAIDEASTERLLDSYLTEGVHGITVLGVMGEAPKLSDSEQRRFVGDVLKRVAGRVPVIVGVSNPGFDNMASLCESAMSQGAAGVMIAGNPGLKTDEQVLAFFAQALERIGSDVPVCLQDYPPTTTVYMSVATINALIARHQQIVMFKHEDCPGHRKLTRLRRAASHDGVRRVSILTGNGGLYVPQELARGADGVMTGFAFPHMLVDVYEHFKNNRADVAENLFDIYLPLVRHEQQIGFGLALRKETLRLRGLLACAATRAPGPALDDDDRAELQALIARLKRRLIAAGELLPTGL